MLLFKTKNGKKILVENISWTKVYKNFIVVSIKAFMKIPDDNKAKSA